MTSTVCVSVWRGKGGENKKKDAFEMIPSMREEKEKRKQRDKEKIASLCGKTC